MKSLPISIEIPEAATAARPDVPMTEAESKIAEALWNEPMDVDSLGREIGLKSQELSSLLLGLEMKRVVRMRPGRIVELAEDLKIMRNP